jgi:Bacterial aa3 type cytochrome c oxidase subunit IV
MEACSASQTDLHRAKLVATVAAVQQNWDATMAIDTSKGHPDMDYAEHTATYKGFLRLTQIAIVLLVLLLIGMFVFLV